jgi:fructose-1,6-bisphosphatase I
MVADLHRTLIKGGIFIYPASTKYPQGKLRLMYECNPLSFIIEQAGGSAIDGKMRIMEKKPESIHERSPIYIGSPENVKKVKELLDQHENQETAKKT